MPDESISQDFTPNCTIVDGDKRIRAHLGKMLLDSLAHFDIEFLATDIAYRASVPENVTHVHILVPPRAIIPDDTIHEVIVWTLSGNTIDDYHERIFPVESFQWYQEGGAR